ncbi:E3 ubiquitin-protein ligase TRAIP-like [Parasteatoda tepidariorum]|uniref:E3 ubiquitin-protein ligase TRAIP-like n=1 Tax=Parasteatoda tepidariorum TaxID=114398 RepID=UPI00077FA7AB|nr:E3 ubiquitin-protein ligase TRAIP-like [Parasteatoda tepidariorum]
MIWNCSICISRLEGVKSCSCTPCGHIFHSDCLKGWITTSQTCPECRRKVSHYNAIKLYPFEKSLDVTLESSTLEYEYFAAKDEIKEKGEEIKSLKAKVEELSLYVATAESQAENFRQQKMELENKIQVANLRLKKMNEQEHQIRNLERSLVHSNAELEMYKNIKTIVHGQQQEVDQILHEVQENDSNGEKEIKKLATYCSILKREFNNTVSTKNKLKDEVTSLKNKNFSISQKLLRLRQERDALKHQMQQLEKENLNSGSKMCSNCSSTGVSNSASMQIGISDSNVFASNSTDSPISVNFAESKKKIDVMVLDDDTYYKKLPTSSKFISRRGQDGIATRIDYGSCFGQAQQDPKLVRRVKMRNNDNFKKHSLLKNIARK